MVVPSVKVLALTHTNLSLDVVIDFMKCFPFLEKLYIKITKYYIESEEAIACFASGGFPITILPSTGGAATAIAWAWSPEPRRGDWNWKNRTASAASPTASSATSYPSSRPRTAPARSSSPPGGAPSGAPLPSTSTSISGVPRILSAHPGPGRRFSVHMDHAATAADLDGWLRSPAVDNLRELEIHFDTALLRWGTPPLPLPASALRFSSTLCVANFYDCVFPDGSNINATGRVLQWPLLKQLTLSSVTVSERSLQALLAGCSALESLLLDENEGFIRVKIVSPSLRRIGVCSRWGYDDDEPRLEQVVIEDAPCLERLVIFEGLEMDISVISAPRLSILGKLYGDCHMIQFGTRGLQVSEAVVGLAAVVPNLRVLALSYVKPCLVIDLMKCFPYLEKLHVEIEPVEDKDKLYDRYQKLTGALDIRLRKIVLAYYHDSKAYIDFAKFFVMNASMLESMRLELKPGDIGKDDVWIRRQHRLLKIGKRASRGARFDFVSRSGSHSLSPENQVHDMSILDPFERIHY